MDAFVYMVLVESGVKNQAMLDFLYRDRTKLAVYGMAMYGIALQQQGDKEKLDMIMQNIGQYVVEDDENQTAYLKLPGGFWWHWYGSEYEAHAYYLKLLARTDPDAAKHKGITCLLVDMKSAGVSTKELAATGGAGKLGAIDILPGGGG